jgi:hypothetical protein
LVFVAALVVIEVTYWRLFYGVDFTDESYYVAVSYRLVHGARPFVDETAVVQQLVAILIYPLVRVYYAAAGTTGIVLFVRHLQFLFSLAVCLAVVLGLRPVLEIRRATLVGLAAVAFVPFDIHSVSYDTLGCGLFAAGCLLGFLSLREPDRRGTRVLAGLCHGLAVFVYPTLIGAVVVCYVLRLALARGRARRDTLAYDLPALALPLVGMTALFASVGLHRVLGDFRHSRTSSVRHADPHKLVLLATHEWHTLRLWFLLLPALALLAVAWHRSRLLTCGALLALPLLVLPPDLDSYTASLEYVAHYGWLALPLLVVVRQHPGATQLFVVCWLPALLAGVTTGYTSSNGGVSVGIGFFPATIVTSAFLIWAFEERGIAVAPTLTVIALLLFFEAVPVYRDGALSTLRARVAEGPYAGLATTDGKRALLARLRVDLGDLGTSCGILFIDDFPAGYLLTRARPDTNSAWTVGAAHDALLRYYRARRLPDVAVVMKSVPYGPGGGRAEHYRDGDPLLRTLRTYPYRLAALQYVVYRRRSGTCA